MLIAGTKPGDRWYRERLLPSWREFLSWLKGRGLTGVRMFTGDKAAAMTGAIAEVFPGAAYQRCTVHFYRNVLSKVPKSKRSQAATILKAIHAMESREASAAKAESVAAELESMRMKETAQVVRNGYAETLAYCEMPRERWQRIRTNSAIERLNRKTLTDAGGRPSEVRRRQRMRLPALSDRDSAQEVALPMAG